MKYCIITCTLNCKGQPSWFIVQMYMKPGKGQLEEDIHMALFSVRYGFIPARVSNLAM